MACSECRDEIEKAHHDGRLFDVGCGGCETVTRNYTFDGFPSLEISMPITYQFTPEEFSAIHAFWDRCDRERIWRDKALISFYTEQTPKTGPKTDEEAKCAHHANR